VRFKVFVAAGAAIAVAFAGPAHAGSFDSVDKRASGSGPAGTWSAASSVGSDGAFSLDTSVVDDPAAAATTVVAGSPVARAGVQGQKQFNLPAGIYDVSVTATGVDADATGTDAGAGYVGLTIVFYCTCRTIDGNGMVYVVQSGGPTKSVRNATVTKTSRITVVDDFPVTLGADMEAASAGGNSRVLETEPPALRFHTGDASARATGVLGDIVVTFVAPLPPVL